MMWRLAVGCLILSGIAGNTAAQNRVDPEAVRSMVDSQFSELDTDDDDQLDEVEIGALAVPALEQLRAHGLSATFPVSRDDFVTAGVSSATAQTPESTKPPESKESTPKSDFNKKSESSDVSNPPVRVIAKKSHRVPELPAEYSARDKNGDGQIGLYEWDRKRYSEFAKLDKNGDGFLTPVELMSKESLKVLYSRTVRDSGESGKAGGAGTAPGIVPPAGAPPSGNAVAASDPVETEARGVFARLDANKDGQIDESEWAGSRTTRPMMESNGAKVSLPIKADVFVGLYRAAKAASGRR